MLLVCVLTVWGLIAYRIFNGLGGAETMANKELVPFEKAEAKNDSSRYLLELDYPDPFRLSTLKSSKSSLLSSLSSAEKSSVDKQVKQGGKNQRSRSNVIKKVKENFIWPEIIFYGLVKDDGSSLFMLQYEGGVIHLRSGEFISDEIKLLKGNQDSVLIAFKERTKYFKRP